MSFTKNRKTNLNTCGTIAPIVRLMDSITVVDFVMVLDTKSDPPAPISLFNRVELKQEENSIFRNGIA